MVSADDAATARQALAEARKTGRGFASAAISDELDEQERRDLNLLIREETGEPAPVFALLSHHSGIDLDRARTLGYDRYLIKPVRPSSVLDCVRPSPGPQPPQAPSARCEGSRDVSDATARRARVLVAEDNQVNAMLARTVLTQAGHYADCVGNGREVLEALENRPYDIVLMDMQMPILDGLSTARRIRSLKGETARIPIIALTANAMNEDRERCLGAGMNDYISKPFFPEDLLQKILFWTAPEAQAEANGNGCAEGAAVPSRERVLGDLLALLDQVEAELPPHEQPLLA